MEKEKLEKRKKIIYEFICDKQYIPMKIKEIAMLLSIQKGQRGELEETLSSLVADGKIEVSKRGKYRKAEQQLILGTFLAHPKGFGFVETEAQEEDIFIPADKKGGAFHKDAVQIALEPRSTGRRKEGSVIRILSHGLTQLVGTFQANDNYGFVVPDDPKIGRDIFVQKGCSMDAVTGHKVVVELMDYGRQGKNPEGRIVELIGHIDDPGTDILSLMKSYDLPEEFPERVANQAIRAAKAVSEADRAGRADYRAWQTVTIDGEDAKDLDDAVTLAKEGDCYVLGVHIADVANYVQEYSALDAEARNRGTSVYLVDRVIPMLPPALSNGICSLNAGEDRLALSCVMRIDETGKVVDHTVEESVIRVDRRMSYTEVKKILEDRDEETMAACRDFVPLFLRMEELSAILRGRRMQRGSIDFDFPETKILLDEMGHPVDIRPYERNTATKIIEDFMLIANETVAEDFFWQQMPFLYRIHDKPDYDKIHALALFLNNFGYSIRMGAEELHPKELQKLLAKIEGTPEEALLSRLTLRSMKQAKYSAVNSGHFGLAAPYYCHFTSPIRRYPDLQIHRIIKEILRGRMDENRAGHYEEILPDVAKHASEMERRAEEAERETAKMKKAEYMAERVGEEFDGVISGITAWGMYVELPNTVEGLVHVTSLRDDYYAYREETYELAGEATNKRYKLGQKVRIVVEGADVLQRTIDFRLAGQDGG